MEPLSSSGLTKPNITVDEFRSLIFANNGATKDNLKYIPNKLKDCLSGHAIVNVVL